MYMKNNVKARRQELGLSARDVGKMSGISGTEVIRIESCESVPTIRTAYELAHVLKMPITELFPDPAHTHTWETGFTGS
jgi:transcriptional regulator with XRE-family HTH domain